MRGLGLAFILAICAVPAAHAASVAVIATGESAGGIPDAAVQSIAWHALNEKYGHDALLLLESDDVVKRMTADKLTSLYRFNVTWEAEAVYVDGGILTDQAPHIFASEHALIDGALKDVRTWEITGAPALYRVTPEAGGGYVALPEVAVQDAMDVAIRNVAPPTWHNGRPERVYVPVILAADDEYRAFYPNWKAEARTRVERASMLLGQAGIELRIVGHQTWNSSPKADNLSKILEEMRDTPMVVPDAIRIGFTQQTGLETHVAASVEDVGRAYNPGHDLVIADQALTPGHDVGWDIAEEGMAIAHELLHVLGAPHLDQPHFLMSGVKNSTVHVIAPSTQQIARSAVQARFQMWDSMTALEALSYTADIHIADEALQVDYILENLASGPGVPLPGQVQPQRVTALTNAAIGHYYLDIAQGEPENADLRDAVIAHGRAALGEHPRVASHIIDTLRPPAQSTDRDEVAEDAPIETHPICIGDWRSADTNRQCLVP